MGYTTDFEGELLFSAPLDAKGLAIVKKLNQVDSAEQPEYGGKRAEWSYFQMELNDDFSGIKWDGSEKYYGAVESVNWLIQKMRNSGYPKFGLKGEMQAQGEEFDDRWILRIVNGVAVKIDNPRAGRKVECPECGHEFMLEE